MLRPSPPRGRPPASRIAIRRASPLGEVALAPWALGAAPSRIATCGAALALGLAPLGAWAAPGRIATCGAALAPLDAWSWTALATTHGELLEAHVDGLALGDDDEVTTTRASAPARSAAAATT